MTIEIFTIIFISASAYLAVGIPRQDSEFIQGKGNYEPT